LNCFTPVAFAVETRLNGGYRLVSTYGANPAEPSAGEPAEPPVDEETLGVGEVPGEVEAVGVAVVVGAVVVVVVVVAVVVVAVVVVAGVVDAGAVGAVVAGLVAVAEALGAGPVPPPTHTAPLIVQPAGWPAVPEDAVTKPTVAGSVKASVQPLTAEVPWLVIVYWPL
jgi:hypothetical protein